MSSVLGHCNNNTNCRSTVTVLKTICLFDSEWCRRSHATDRCNLLLHHPAAINRLIALDRCCNKKSRVGSKHRGPFNPLSQLKMKLKTKLQFEIEISAKMKMKLKLKHKKNEWMKAVCEEWKPREYIQSNAVNQSELSQIHFTNKNISLPGSNSSKNRTKGKWFQKQTGAEIPY